MKLLNGHKKGQKAAFIFSIIAVIVILSATTYAALTLIFDGGNQRITVGTLTLSFSDTESNALNLSVMPMSNIEGLAQTDYYEFSVQNNGNESIAYRIEVVGDTAWEDSYTGQVLSNNYITVGLMENGVEKGPFVLGENDNILEYDIIKPGVANKKTYRLRLWINEEDITNENKSFISEAVWHGKLNIFGEQSFAALSYLNAGVMVSGLTLDGDIVSYLSGLETYNLLSYTCASGSTLSWSTATQKLTATNLIANDSCQLNFEYYIAP